MKKNKYYIAIGYYYGGPFVDIFKDTSIRAARNSADNNMVEPFVLELEKFQKLYNKAYDKANVNQRGNK